MKHITNIETLLVIVLLVSLLCSFQKDCVGLGPEESDPYAPYDNGVPEGFRLIEGDIIVPETWIQGVFATNWWPDGIVPYEFDINVSAANRTAMLAAMAEWEAVANVDFVQLNGESNYVHVQNATVNSSMVGMQGGMQVINIASWGSRFIIAHELAHALGFWHEQSRLDRDIFVIIEDRITDGNEPNFYRHDEADVYGPYDFNSVMHYGQCSFSCCNHPTNPCCPAPCACGWDPNNCRTITVRPPWDTTWQNAIGQRTSLSRLDQLTMSFIYPEPDWVFVDQSYTGGEQGTFLQPYTLFNTGALVVPAGGTVIIQPGNYDEVGTYMKAMTLRAPLGGVILGE